MEPLCKWRPVYSTPVPSVPPLCDYEMYPQSGLWIEDAKPLLHFLTHYYHCHEEEEEEEEEDMMGVKGSKSFQHDRGPPPATSNCSVCCPVFLVLSLWRKLLLRVVVPVRNSSGILADLSASQGDPQYRNLRLLFYGWIKGNIVRESQLVYEFNDDTKEDEEGEQVDKKEVVNEFKEKELSVAIRNEENKSTMVRRQTVVRIPDSQWPFFVADDLPTSSVGKQQFTVQQSFERLKVKAPSHERDSNFGLPGFWGHYRCCHGFWSLMEGDQIDSLALFLKLFNPDLDESEGLWDYFGLTSPTSGMFQEQTLMMVYTHLLLSPSSSSKGEVVLGSQTLGYTLYFAAYRRQNRFIKLILEGDEKMGVPRSPVVGSVIVEALPFIEDGLIPIAITGGCVRCVDLLLKHGAPMNDRSSDLINPDWPDLYPLQHAAAEGSLDIVQLLVEKYKRLSDEPEQVEGDDDEIYSTPLYLAAVHGRTNVVRFLLEQYALLFRNGGEWAKETSILRIIDQQIAETDE